MKIAIQGHPTRGHEIIQILESLGGKNTNHLHGNNYDGYYCILGDNHITSVFSILGHKVYTLEEFEKEFPFKIGDIALLKGVNKPYEVIALELYMDKLCYKLDNGLHYRPETLTVYKDMMIDSKGNPKPRKTIESTEPFYWEKLEHQYAGMAMQGILSNQDYCKLLVEENIKGSFAEDVSRCASGFAHALVKKMKGD